MKLSFKIHKHIDLIFDYLTDMQKFVSVHPVISLKENQDSEYWKEGFDYELVIKPFGLMNIWGIHRIKVVSIDRTKTEIITVEKNNICKVWNHKLTYKKIGENQTEYTDGVTLYAGWLTSVLSHFLIYSYKKRHQNWDKLLTGK